MHRTECRQLGPSCLRLLARKQAEMFFPYLLETAFQVKCREADARVTRSDEFSSMGRLFTLGSFLKITEVSQSFELHIFPL
jgi:hypothetical protein